MPDSQTYTIDDFTSGIHTFSGPGAYPGAFPLAPPGSAASAFRCYARQGIGLLPLPTYQPIFGYSVPGEIAGVAVSMGNLKGMAGRGGVVADLVASFLVQHGVGFGANTDFHIVRCAPLSFNTANLGTTIYTSTATSFPQNTTSWPMMDFGVFQDPTTKIYSRVLITSDPISTSPLTTSGTATWLMVRGWTTATNGVAPEFSSGSFTSPFSANYPRTFYHANRMGIWQVGSSRTPAGFLASDSDSLQVSNILDPRTITAAGVFFPEMGTFVGSWGSISTGEYIGIYHEGGAFLIYGDLFAPSSVQRLGGVMGTGGLVGPAAISPIGLLYPRYNGHVYLWNGDNTSTNISPQIPQGQFQRTTQSQGFGASPMANSSMAVWNEWVAFPNNWLFDTLTQSWWRTEDPSIINFQVFAESAPVDLAAAPGIAYSFDPGTPASITTYLFRNSIATSTWFWQSNPMPATVGSLVTLNSIEIVASNLTSTSARITIQPLSPANGLANQTTSSVTFDVPANTAGYRAKRRTGYNDYNIQLAVNASNTNNQAAPTLHSISCEYTPAVSSGLVH